MCGIAGIYRCDRIVTEGDMRAVRAMMDAIHHRGPDDEGVVTLDRVVLGHKRLSIIDIDSGHQPMSNDCGSIWIVLNGEIYNYIEIRDELRAKGVVFKTKSDTEVLLKLYEQYGASCIEKLNGMFAFAIWNDHTQTLVICRDRLGIKPLYYIYDGERFAFASEIKAFINAGILVPELNNRALKDYIVLQMGLSEETLFKKVKKLMPGNLLILSPKGLEERAYWKLDFTIDPNAHEDEQRYIEELRDLLEDAVHIQTRSDVPVGAHLSGGMDSSAVCCLASRALGGELHTFNGYFGEGGIYDESKHARLVNKELGLYGHFCSINYKDGADYLEEMIRLMDEPQVGPGLIPQYFVSKLARHHVKVVLSGLGGDETFGGYARYYLAYLESCLKGAIEAKQRSADNRFVVTFESMLPNLLLMKEYIPLMQTFWAEGLFESPSRRYFRLMRRDIGGSYFSKDVINDNMVKDVETRFESIFYSSGASSLLNQLLAFDLKVFIPALLQVEDRTSMAVSLESRVPLLDHRIVEYAAKMPPTVKWKGGRPKHVLREAVRGFVPKLIWERTDKRGFPTPVAEWFNGPLRGYVHEIMTSKPARERGLYNHSALTSASASAFDRSLWGALCVELWHRQFIDS